MIYDILSTYTAAFDSVVQLLKLTVSSKTAWGTFRGSLTYNLLRHCNAMASHLKIPDHVLDETLNAYSGIYGFVLLNPEHIVHCIDVVVIVI